MKFIVYFINESEIEIEVVNGFDYDARSRTFMAKTVVNNKNIRINMENVLCMVSK